MGTANSIIEICKGDDLYPEFLSMLEDAPPKLYCIGDLNLLKEKRAAVVGARKCSEYGRQVALKLGEILAKNDIVTVSGMATGVDSFAHSGALKNQGKTIAVLGTGPDICYPRYNKNIYEEICKKGLIISEHEPKTKAKPWHFPKRNRIISAISQVVAVVEAGVNSGSLITAEYAAEQGKEVLAVPGNINSAYSLGCNKLIADGASILTVPEDVLRALNVSPKILEEEMLQLGKDEQKILKILKEHSEISIENMCRLLNEEPSVVSGIIAVLELKGFVSYHLGKIFIAKF